MPLHQRRRTHEPTAKVAGSSLCSEHRTREYRGTNGLPSSLDCSCLRLAISARQGSHQVAKKWTRTIRPRSRASSCVGPSRLGSENNDWTDSSRATSVVLPIGLASSAVTCAASVHSATKRETIISHLRSRPTRGKDRDATISISSTVVGAVATAFVEYYCGRA